MNKKQKIDFVFDTLRQMYPNPQCELNFSNDFELLVAVILSAQCTDKRVNIVTNELFKQYKTPQDFANMSQAELENIIKPCGLYRNKAKSIINASKMLIEKFDCKLPKTATELMALPGVGRKVANVVSSIANKEDVLGVDTHIFRVSNRLGLVDAKTPYDVEMQWIKNYPEYVNHDTHYSLILFGRYFCTARNPKCKDCKFCSFCKEFKRR